MRIYAYLRASTKEQDAARAKTELEEFAKQNDFVITAFFIENVSGASLMRPELMRLLDVAAKGDVILIEQVDRITRLTSDDWDKLKGLITEKGLRVVSLDLPTSFKFLTDHGDDFTARMQGALNNMLLDVLAAVARKDYEDLKKRQAQGIANAKKQGKFKGRTTKNTEKREQIKMLLLSGIGYNDIAKTVKCGKSMIADVKKSLDSAQSHFKAFSGIKKNSG